MNERFNAQKEIENLTTMTGNSFGIVFEKLENFHTVFERLDTADQNFNTIFKRLDENDAAHESFKFQMENMNKKLDLILNNMITKYEFKALTLRLDTLEQD